VGKKDEFGIILEEERSAMSVSQAEYRMETLSFRELEILHLISKGLSNREIAHKLYLSVETIKWYNKQIFMKLGVKNRTQAANKALNLISWVQNLRSYHKKKLPSREISQPS
jgi:ATP/maltotriose-dependent transcriptional regulator MalT